MPASRFLSAAALLLLAVPLTHAQQTVTAPPSDPQAVAALGNPGDDLDVTAAIKAAMAKPCVTRP